MKSAKLQPGVYERNLQMYVRTCQECGTKHVMRFPSSKKAFEAKCRKCKSAALDFGSDGWEYAFDGNLVRKSFDDTEEQSNGLLLKHS